MLYDLNSLLNIANEQGFAVPAFNIYNFESLLGVKKAVEETDAPVIFQVYNRLFDTGVAKYLLPAMKTVANELKTPCAIHLDHGAGMPEIVRGIRYGVSGVMIDASTLEFNANVEKTKAVVEVAKEASVSVEAELGHVGNAAAGDENGAFTEVDAAVKFVNETGIDALAIMVGTAHGKYKKAPVLSIDRIAELHRATKAHLVLHGGSGVPDGQICAAVKAGIRKINYATDVCCAFIEGCKKLDPYNEPLDVYLSHPTDDVKAFAIDRIKVLRADAYRP